MRIATWNVNSIRTRLDQVSTWLAEQQPEVLCLQETKVSDDLFPHQAFESMGYTARISGQKAYNGVAILSRLPIQDVRVGFEALLPGDSDATRLGEQKRAISAEIEGIRILNLYVPNGSSLKSEKYAYKLEWLACLGRYLEVEAQLGEPLAIVGDFNIALEARDIHDPERLEGGNHGQPGGTGHPSISPGGSHGRCVSCLRARAGPLELVGLSQRCLGSGQGMAHRSHLPRRAIAGPCHQLCDSPRATGTGATQRSCTGGGETPMATRG